MATIVLIHGLWMTPASWEGWADCFTAAGHRVITPAWPGMEGRTVEDLRRDTSAYARDGVGEIVDSYDAVIRGLDEPPIIMGHSFGGLVTQLLLARGLGKAGVAVDPAQPKGILGLPLSTVRVTLAGGLGNPANRHKAIMLTPKQFHYAFMNHTSEAEAQPVYDRLPIPGPARTLFQAGLANFNPNAVTKIDYKADRAPLMIFGGGIDHVVPASTTRANFKLQKKSPAITAYREWPGRSHYTVSQDGWEAVADFALEWALNPSVVDKRD